MMEYSVPYEPQEVIPLKQGGVEVVFRPRLPKEKSKEHWCLEVRVRTTQHRGGKIRVIPNPASDALFAREAASGLMVVPSHVARKFYQLARVHAAPKMGWHVEPVPFRFVWWD